MPKVKFMRHAKTTLNKENIFAGRTDCDTTPEGLEDAKKGFTYTQEDFDYYICSTLRRTVQTLNAVIPGQIPIIDDRILVVAHAGVLRQVRDNFLPDMNKGIIKNSEYNILQ